MAKLGAGVRKRADGTLEKRFTVNGERHSVYGKTQKEITEKEQELRKKIDAGLYTDNRNITLDQYYEEWKKNKRNNTKGNTLRSYNSAYQSHVKSVLGKRKVQAIERREVVKLQNDIAATASVTMANYVITVLRVMFKDAVRDEIIDKSPIENIKNIKNICKAAETNHRALTEDEQKAFMQEIKNDYYYEFIALLLSTGMRCGEVSALTWSDIDYKENVIHINKTVTLNELGQLGVGDTPKSAAGKRDIPLNDTIKNILAMQRSKMGNIVSINNQRVFTSVYGGCVRNLAVNDSIRKALNRLDKHGVHIEYFTAHALRDTFATRYIEQGGKPQTLKTILGHSSLAMTMDLYAHVLPNTKQEEMDSIHIAI